MKGRALGIIWRIKPPGAGMGPIAQYGWNAQYKFGPPPSGVLSSIRVWLGHFLVKKSVPSKVPRALLGEKPMPSKVSGDWSEM